MLRSESIEALEVKEEQLRSLVADLPQEQRKRFFAEQAKQLKDPDTYAALNWLFLGGFHHLYLRKYAIFAVEFTLLIIVIIALVMGFYYAGIILIALTVYELPQLFFSQKIARQYNYNLSMQIYQDVYANKR
ncbi:membrane protein [Photobacterium aquae]|uniref:Membrane protein n=1 Tax=Photobacterium aquae TaxID=1195763 RepID=A0A0J1HBP6_9GAMM|nr:hypothetical protein [Photobacterium aquae]KLV09070.1 membrane protein [Photobacterium aquae]